MNRSKLIKEIIKEMNEEVTFLNEEFDQALIGTSYSKKMNIIAVYDSDICIKTLMKEHNLNGLEALKRFQDSISYYSKEKHPPVFISDFRNIKIPDIDNLDSIDMLDTLDELEG